LYDASPIGEADRMPRRTAAERHLDSVPAPAAPDASSELADLLVAYHHPIRRWLCELLALEGPANVGQLAARTELAVGSVSHHLKALHRQGLVEPAPDLARDTRESWWRLCDRPLTWSVDDFEEGTLGRRVAETAEIENFRHQVRAVQAWLQQQARDERPWRLAAESVDTLTYATVEQLDDLGDRLTRLVTEWSSACAADSRDRPDAVRRPVRAIARAFPSAPVRP
jgi:DNA-binding transcriptional ArsR family regulator